IPTCTPLPIVVRPVDPLATKLTGTPPYYMISIAVGDGPVTTPIGTDQNNLSWTVTQPVGSQVFLIVVDAKGSSVGISQLVTVIVELEAGQSTHCVSPRIITPSFILASNVTDGLNTCQPWGLTVTGGLPPYNLMLAALKSPFVTNVTMPVGLNSFTFINRTDPGTQLIELCYTASSYLINSVGRWATGTPVVKMRGMCLLGDFPK
ncbi:hypothetical protein GALMADRAFT_77340, partial [Galerina marginata CBS 339.88]